MPYLCTNMYIFIEATMSAAKITPPISHENSEHTCNYHGYPKQTTTDVSIYH